MKIWLKRSADRAFKPIRQTVIEERFNPQQAGIIMNRQQLQSMQPAMKACISHEFGAETLAARLCPVLLDDQSVALFALKDYVATDQADELLRQIAGRGYKLATPTRYILDASLMLLVAGSQLVLKEQGVKKEAILHSRSVLVDVFQDLLEWGVKHNASDIHLNLFFNRSESEVKYTINGRYVAPYRFSSMSTTLLIDMLAVVWMDIKGGNGALFDPRREQQGSLTRMVNNQEVMIRWASLAADDGPSVCLRLLVRNMAIPQTTLAQLGYLSHQVSTIERSMQSEGGAVVFAGTVGSGKTTTLATLISSLPNDRKIITLEDPVEYQIPNAIQNTVVRTLSDNQPLAYASKLRTIKRSAMTDVLLGEVRDIETGQAFMDLAGSGVNVYTTIHAPNAPSIPQRLMSDFIGVSADFLQTPGTLRLLVFQVLMGRLCLFCSLPASELLNGFPGLDGQMKTGAFWGRWLAQIETLYKVDTSVMRIRNPEGCTHCEASGIASLKGYQGRTVSAELIEPELQPDYLDSVRTGKVGLWLSRQLRTLSLHGLDHEQAWHSAMDSAVLKAMRAEVDPRDIERHFQFFETRSRAVKELCIYEPAQLNTVGA